MQTSELDALEAQTNDLIALVGELTDAQFDLPTRCPGWTVKELVAHCIEMMVRLPNYAQQKVDATAEIDRSSYYGYDPDGPREEEPDKTFSEFIKDRVIGEVAGRGPTELRAALDEAASSMLAQLRDIPADLVIKRDSHRPIAMGELVATRVLEFGIHAMDIGHATLRGERLHPDAQEVIKGLLLGRLNAELPKGMGWTDRTFILSGTGRRQLERNERFALGSLASKFPLLR
jgi:uncharacterized protein (TIGR03083 family)